MYSVNTDGFGSMPRPARGPEGHHPTAAAAVFQCSGTGRHINVSGAVDGVGPQVKCAERSLGRQSGVFDGPSDGISERFDRQCTVAQSLLLPPPPVMTPHLTLVPQRRAVNIGPAGPSAGQTVGQGNGQTRGR